MTQSIRQSPDVRRAIERTIGVDALARGLRALWPGLMIVAGAGAVGGLTQNLPPFALSALAGVTLALAAWALVRAAWTFQPMTEAQARLALEQQAGLLEAAPLSLSEDRRVAGDRALWDWHQHASDQAAGSLVQPLWPRPTLADGARWLALLLACGLCLAQPQAAAHALSFDLSPLAGDSDLVMDVWAQPPEHTGLPAIRLSRDTSKYALPEGALLLVRMDGAKGAPVLRVAGRAHKLARARGQAWTTQVHLTKGGTITLDRLGTRARWHVTLIKDKAPSFDGPVSVQTDGRGRLDVAFSPQDDYGITSAALRINPRDTLVGLVGHDRFDTPLDLDLGQGEEGARQFFVDVAQHALVGLDVEIQVVIRDATGQETASPVQALQLPEPEFKTTLGLALQEQRLLILREARPYQKPMPTWATLFDAAQDIPIKLDLTEGLAGAPPGIVRAQALLRASLSALRTSGMSDIGIMALHYAQERLSIARSIPDAYSVAALLWEVAVQAEADDQTPAQQAIAQARQALEQALRGGAGEEQIKRLNQDLREAIGQRLNELAQQGDTSGAGTGEGETETGGGDSVSGGDIDDRLKELEQSGTSGARQDALDQLDQLAELMDKLQGGGGGANGGDPADSSQSGTGGATGLDDVMQQQRALSDDTQARQDSGQNSGQGPPLEELAQRQEALARELAPSGPSGAPSGEDAQVEAGKAQAASAMRRAAQALQQGDLTGARAAQNDAERALQDLAQAQSARGEGGGAQDPLGRSIPNSDDGNGTKVPDKGEKRRARDVRDELRRRQSDPSRTPEERDYLDRLLRDR